MSRMKVLSDCVLAFVKRGGKQQQLYSPTGQGRSLVSPLYIVGLQSWYTAFSSANITYVFRQVAQMQKRSPLDPKQQMLKSSTVRSPL